MKGRTTKPEQIIKKLRESAPRTQDGLTFAAG